MTIFLPWETVIIVFLVSVLLIVVVVAFGIIPAIQQKRRTFVAEQSFVYNKMCELNSEINFFPVYPDRHRKYCKSKQEYTKTRCDDLLLDYVSQNKVSVLNKMETTKKNGMMYLRYLDRVQTIREDPVSTPLYQKYSFFKEYEDALCSEIELRPTLAFSVSVEVRYTSPQGRNHYVKSQDYNENSIQNVLREAEKQEQARQTQQATRQRERAAMTESLRYDIMRRDGFRCVLCGATATDGITLHVDHILPVSKGGKTVPGNLRTLCSRCNFGKRDKYDEYGPN